MALLTFTYPDGSAQTIEAGGAPTVMHAAVAAGINGIVGECGGSAMCATCHVYVAADDLDKLPPMQPPEDEMLDCGISPRRPGSRLACQIAIGPEIESLSLEIPEEQL